MWVLPINSYLKGLWERTKKNRNRNKIGTPEPVNRPGNTNQVLQPPIIPSRLLFLLILIVSALAIFLYAGSYGHDFAYDDIAVVKENRFVQQGIGGIPSILRSQYFEGYDPHTNARAYRPVSLVTYSLEKEFFGLNASAHHAVNILLYAFLAIFLLLALLRLTREKINPERTSPSDNYNLYLGYLMVGDQQKANYYKVLSGK